MIKYLDMFAGIGGFRTGLANVGDFFVPVGWCEIDKHAQQAYRALYDTGGEYFCDDARKIRTDELPDIDLICAGFPCQSFSVAGRRGGFNDPRGTLFFEVARVAASKRPAYLLLENVPGLLSHDKGGTFAAILSTLSELGYDVTWQVLNSADFGVPQSRKRVYIIGYLRGKSCGRILSFIQSNATALKQVIPGSQGSRVYSENGLACTLTSNAGGFGGKTGLYFVDLNPDPIVTDKARCITTRQNAGISNRKGEHSGVIISGTRAVISPTKEKIRQKGRRIKEPDEPMYTLTAQDRHGVTYNGIVRSLTPRECFRLQGFSDEQYNKLEALGISKAQLYKMAGNSVTTNVVTAVGKKLKEEIQEDLYAQSC